MNKKFLYISLLSIFSINLCSEVLEKSENGNYIPLTYENTGKKYINEQYLGKEYLKENNNNKENIDNTQYVENNDDENIDNTHYVENNNEEENINKEQVQKIIYNEIEETPENNEMVVEELPKTLKPDVEKEIIENNNEEENINKEQNQNLTYNEIKQVDNTVESMEEEKRIEQTIFEDQNKKELKDLNVNQKPKITIFNR